MKKLFVLFLLCMATSMAFAQSSIVIAGDRVVPRSQPSEAYKMLNSSIRFYTGDRLNCGGMVNGYYEVYYKGNTYYIPQQYGRPRGGSNNAPSRKHHGDISQIVIAGDRVVPRSQPSEAYKMLNSRIRFYTGDRLRCGGMVNGYYEVYYKGNTYYIPEQYGRARY